MGKYNERKYKNNLKLEHSTIDNGKKFGYIDFKKVDTETLNIPVGSNSKLGKNVASISFPIWNTCRHDCECFREKKCYGCNGCYNFTDNQIRYAENLAYFNSHDVDTIVNNIKTKLYNKVDTLRFFGIGDFTPKILEVFVELARTCEWLTVYCYTKKYDMVNSYVDKMGLDYIPGNATIIFSHWLNSDGTYLEMNNKYSFPTSEFIPLGKEYLLKSVTYVCECSNPEYPGKCETCNHSCKNLSFGQSMALIEHSTKETKERDKALKISRGKVTLNEFYNI